VEMRKTMFVVLAVVLVASFLVSGVFAAPAKPYKISLLTGTLDNPYWITVKDAATMAAKDFGVDLTVVGVTKEGDANTQTGQMEDRVAAGDAAIVAAVQDSKALIPAVVEANKQNIPVIAVDKSIDKTDQGGKIASVIMTDNPAAAAQGATWLVNKIGGKGTVLLLEGAPGGQTAIDRKTGAANVFAKNPGIKVISIPGDWETAKAQSVTEDTLTANPDLVGIFASNDMMAIGAQTAVAARKLNIPICGFDAVDAALTMVADGRIGADVAQFPARMGYMGVEFAVRVIEGKQVPEMVDSGAMLITSDNVNAFKAGLFGK
jgi:ribose transport system substrate-binding protein